MASLHENTEKLVTVKKQPFLKLPLPTSIKVWYSLQIFMDKIIKAGGGNEYKLPHMHKDKWVCENGCRILLHLKSTAVEQQIAQGPQQVQHPEQQHQQEQQKSLHQQQKEQQDQHNRDMPCPQDLPWAWVKWRWKKKVLDKPVMQGLLVWGLICPIDENVDWEDITADIALGDDDDHLVKAMMW